MCQVSQVPLAVQLCYNLVETRIVGQVGNLSRGNLANCPTTEWRASEGSRVKIEIRNLGVVKQAEIDLRPLTVFVGPNNVGKTWVAYALGGILGPYGWNQYLSAYMAGQTQQEYPPLDDAIQQVLDEGNAQIDMVQFADEYGKAYFNDVTCLARQWMQKFMGTERASFNDLEVHVRLEERKAHFLEGVQDAVIKGKLSASQRREGALLNALKEQGEPMLYLYTASEGDVLEKLPVRAMEEFLIRTALQVFQRVLLSNVHLFPTERTTFVTFPFGPATPGIPRVTTSEGPQQERAVSLAVPVNSFLVLMQNLFNGSQSRMSERAKDNPEIQTYIQLAQLLEDEILNGSVGFSTPEPQPGRELIFQSTEGIRLDMPVVSSMVKELSPLVLYLRYLAEPETMIIIDEPEMNLHPKAQVQLTEFLVMLVNAGLHVLITTHSPYIVDHLENLMKAAKSADKDVIRDKFYLKQAEAFIPKEQVSVYLFEDGTAKDILDKEGMIEWGTFGDVSDEISNLYFEI